MEVQIPSEEVAARVAHEFSGENIAQVRRFTTGLAHHVYDVTTEGNQKFVVRMSAPRNRDLLKSGVYWSEKLRPIGVPLPKILGSDTNADIPYVLLERLEGSDLGDEYSRLNPAEKREIAHAVSHIQGLVSQLPPGSGFGFTSSYESGSPLPSWTAVINRSLARSRSRIESVGIVETSFVDAIERLLPRYQSYFDNIQPIPFLDDTTTKNVIVSDGKLTGIVDVDQVCFGDSLFTIALTRMALMNASEDLDYIEYWCERIHANERQRSALGIYTALFCVDFMSEIGQTFNRESAEIDLKWLEHLKHCHTRIMRQIESSDVS